MQTFLPFADFRESARALDNRRLGKQRVEGYQILKALTGQYADTNAWTNHPAVRMWRGFVPALTEYTLVCCEVWHDRGYGDSIADKIYCEFSAEVEQFADNFNIIPHWLRDERVHASHRAMLHRKDPVYYMDWANEAKNIYEYYWPV